MNAFHPDARGFFSVDACAAVDPATHRAWVAGSRSEGAAR